MKGLWNMYVPSPSRALLYKFLLAPVIGLAFFVQSPVELYAAFGDGGPTVFNPNLFTGGAQNLRVDGPTGAFTYKIPIKIPPGRNGLQPDLALEYNNQRAEDSIVGYGWNLNIPYIQRLNKTGSQSLYFSDATFASSLDGELIPVSTSTMTHRARVDVGSANAYTFSGNTWTVYDKRGTKYTFGSSDSGRQYDTATSSANTYKWMLQEIRDTNNNYVEFSYSENGNELYPDEISYTGFESTDGPFTISFATTTRSDIRESYEAGFKITTNYKISQITAAISGSTVGRYDLSYGTGNNGVRSLLTSVQQHGWDESSNQTTLPASTFSYMSTFTQFYKPGAGSYPIDGQAWQGADTNGNGILDVNTFFTCGSLYATMYIDQTTAYQNYQSASAPPDYWAQCSPLTPLERGVRYVDTNGDGKADVVTGVKNDYTSATTTALFVNNYSTSTNVFSWAASSTFSGTVPYFRYTTANGLYTLTTGLFGELNGDGFVDYSMALNSYTGDDAYLGNGSAWTATSTAFAPKYQMPTTVPSARASRLIDINGDSLDDWVYDEGNSIQVKLNNGSGWESSASTQWAIATSTLYNNSGTYYDRGVRFFDLNGDSLTDFVRSYTGVSPGEAGSYKVVLLNTGNGWATSTAYTLPAYITSVAGSGITTNNEYANWTGNGQMEQDVINHITYPTGGTKSVIYTPSAQLGTNPELPISMLVVTEVGESDGIGGAVGTTTYAYGGGTVYLAGGAIDRKFAGFRIATTTAPDSVSVTYYSQGNGIDSGLGEQTDGFALINRPFRVDLFDAALQKRTYYRWDSWDVLGSLSTNIAQEMVWNYGTSTTHKDKAAEYLYASTTNDVIRATEWGQVTGSVDGTFSDSGTDKRMTTYTYIASSTVNMSVPKSRTLFDYSNATSTDELYYYDTLSLGSVGKGNRTKIERLKTGSTYLSEQKAYNTYGLPTSSTDPRGKVTTYTYDAKNLYIATSTNALSHDTEFYYDYTLGKPKQTIDPNSRIFETTYDGLDRPLAEKQPDISSPSSLVNKKTYAYTDTIGLRKILETNYLDGSTDFTIYKYLDGLDRVYQIRKEAEDSQYAVQDFIFNNAGLLQKESLPYFSSGSSTTTATATNALYSSYTYDGLRRITTAANAVGTTTNVYDEWTIGVTDALDNQRQFIYDAFGRLAQVILPVTSDGEEPSGGGGVAFADDLIKLYALATEDLPLAITGALDFFSDSTSSSTASTTSEEVAAEVEEQATTTPQTTEEVGVPPEEVVSAAPAPQISIDEQLVGKSASEKATIKGQEIGKIGSIPRTERSRFDIEVLSMETIQNGVQVFVRAWRKDGTQIGFGRKGTVEIERFVIINPPVLIEDLNGTIIREWTSEYTGEKIVRKLKEDPKEALLQSIEHTLSVKQEMFGPERIVFGKVGNTTTTVYPDANTESTSVDGAAVRSRSPGSGEAWSTLRSSSGTGSQDSSSTGLDTYAIADETVSNTWRYLGRGFFLFDTSSIPDSDTVSSATFSLYGTSADGGKRDYDDAKVALVGSTPASNTAIVSSDYSTIGTTRYASSDVDLTDWSNASYNTWTFNSTGRTNVSKTGITKLGTRLDKDLDNVSPTWSNVVGINNYLADQSGTTNDPKLVVEHSAEVINDENVTTYTYDAADNLVQIVDARDNVRNFTYDNLNRRLTAEDVHDTGDGTYGTWTYVYDAAGNLATTTDPKGQVIDYLYDDLNRVLTENYTGASGTEVTYEYDTCSEGVGRLCIATSTGAATTLTYNALGLTASEQKRIDGTNYTTSFTYNRQGGVTGIVYPDNSEVQYTYNTAGLLESVSQKESGDSFDAVVSDFDYSPHEKIAYKLFGNGVESVYTYATNQLYRLSNILTTASSTQAGVDGGLGFADPLLKLYAQVTEELPLAVMNFLGYSNLTLAPREREERAIDDLVPEPELTPAPVTDPIPEVTPNVAPVEEQIITEPATTTQEVLVTEMPVPVAPPELTPILATLEGKTAQERATIKGREIAKIGSVARVAQNDYDIEITSLEAIEGGVQAFARAWNKDGSQIGFGQDGSIDVERFRIFNPPVLVLDPNGDVVRKGVNPLTNEPIEYRLREDPREALLQSINHIIAVKKEKFTAEKIVAGRVGNTTSTFYPDGNTESTSVDGGVVRSLSPGSNESWATIRSSSGTGVQDSASTGLDAYVISDNGTNGWRYLGRGVFLFDTSALPDTDSISAATFSVYGSTVNGGKVDNFNMAVAMVASTPASNTSLAASDYSNVSATRQSDTDIDITAWSNSAYNNWSLNATGIANIVKTGVTKFGTRLDKDVDNSAPTWSDSIHGGVDYYLADAGGTSNDPKLVVEHTADTNDAPSAPTGHLTEAQTNPVYVSDPTPEFSALYIDLDTADVATHYRLQVSTSSVFATIKWDTAQTSLASSTPQGTRIADITYGGSALASSTTYYWRIKFWDTAAAEGAWSTATSTFALSPTVNTPTFYRVLQNTSYTYDAIGNITQVADNPSTGVGKTVLYEYDDLYRLVTASTTAASSTPFRHQYSYGYLGGMTGWKSNSSATSTYDYAETNYANPHAPTQIGNGSATTTYSYDQNGNLTSTGVPTYAWDYRNRMGTTTSGSATTTYAYDHTVMRVMKGTGLATTTYPSKFYNTGSTTASRIKHIYAGDELLATVLGSGATATTTYIHTDHLGGTAAVTATTSATLELFDPYPYGTERINTTFGQYNDKLEQKKFAQTERDTETNLDYANARYYEGGRGQFLSQDPVFWEVGLTRDGRAVLRNPQAQNSYNYAQNNPIVNKDPDGRIAVGVGFEGGAGTPGLYGSGSGYGVLAFSLNPFNVEVGFITSGQGGGSTALGGFEGTAGLLFSNARNISELEGPEAVIGGSVRAGLDFGADVSLSKSNSDPNRKIVTVTPSAGLGLVGTPYVLPAELHGGGGYTKAWGTVNLTQAFTNAANATRAGVQSVQSGAISAFQSAFKATNAAQEKAVQAVIKAFSRK